MAMACLSPTSIRRPTMNQVVTELSECLSAEGARNRRDGEYESLDSVGLMTMNLGTTSTPLARYKEDAYDRAWWTYTNPDWKQLSTNLSIGSGNDDYEPPALALQTAGTPVNASRSMEFSISAPPYAQLYVYMHFAEIEKLQPNESRVFNISYNGQLWYERYSPAYLLAAVLWRLKRRKPLDGDRVKVEMTAQPLESKKRLFTFAEVQQMTNNFERILGRGGFGTVFHGYLEGTQVAVKMLSPSSVQGPKQFQAEAKLADFGLSKAFLVEGGTHISTSIAGTPGYLDPEYYISNRLTEKSDVYCYGIVLLEIITSQPVIMQINNERTHISQWVSSMLSNGDIKNIVDPRLRDFDVNSVWKVVEMAMACLSPTSARRPTMTQVLMEVSECLSAERARNRRDDEIESLDSVGLMTMNLGTMSTPLAR
ncbi:hypothetical protein COLO4_30560 [Corchorus olitorius]|uniref:Protein kinase domain-containing protein n=1 Tax=Corchorus olitorius TaxID=93759 RepID=A0A1R3H7W8_9ROSI|nr:hypothetical protein COLO4_30560 [Corchorus olitorius]